MPRIFYLLTVYALLVLHNTSLSSSLDVSDSDLLAKAEIYLYSYPDSAIFYLESYFQSSKENPQLARAYALMGKAFDIQSKYDSALYYYNLGVSLTSVSNLPEFYAQNLKGQGDVLLVLGRMSSAQEKFTIALSCFDSLGLEDMAAGVYASMGFLFQRSNDLKKAKECYDQALSRRNTTDYSFLISLATWYGRMNMPDSALFIYERVLNDPGLKSNPVLLARVYNNGAIIHDQLGNHDKVIQYSQKAIANNRQLGNLSSLGVVYQNLTQYHFLRGDYKRSRVCLDSGYFFAKKVGDLNVFIKLLGIDVEFEKLNNNYRRAEAMMEYYDYLKDSLHNLRQESLVHELNIQYETASNKQKIAELELEQKNVALSLARANNQRNIFISGFVLLIGVAGFLYYRYDTKKKTSDILAVKNNQISKSLAERETLLKEIHHRVKNNLQVISSLLNLQAETLEDDAAISAVRQGQNRVKSMALIHQRLYSTDDVRGVDIQDYLESLCAELFNAFGVNRDRIEFVVETHGLKMDIDTVIPMGLIINELVTNCIKYAFPNDRGGQIQIQVYQEGEVLRAKVSDNGVGTSEVDLSKLNSFGWKMVHILAMKVKGTISVKNQNGTVVELVMKRFKLVS